MNTKIPTFKNGLIEQGVDFTNLNKTPFLIKANITISSIITQTHIQI